MGARPLTAKTYGKMNIFQKGITQNHFKAFSGVAGFVKVSNINDNLRLTENLHIQRRTSKSIFRSAQKLR